MDTPSQEAAASAWAHLMTQALDDDADPHGLLPVIRQALGDADTVPLRQLLVGLTAVAQAIGVERHWQGPGSGAARRAWRSAKAIANVAGCPDCRDHMGAARDYLTQWFTSSLTGDVALLSWCKDEWRRMSGQQRMVVIAKAIIQLRAESAALPAATRQLLGHTITAAPVPTNPFAHILCALWAAALDHADAAVRRQRHIMADHIDVIWICVRCIASRLHPGHQAVAPPGSQRSTTLLSRWITASAAGAPDVRRQIEAGYTAAVVGSDTSPLLLDALQWLSADWAALHSRPVP